MHILSVGKTREAANEIKLILVFDQKVKLANKIVTNLKSSQKIEPKSINKFYE